MHYIYSLLDIFKSTVRRNLVSMRYSVANCVLEMFGLLLVVVLLTVDQEYAHILYILFTNVGTPSSTTEEWRTERRTRSWRPSQI